MTGQFQVQKGRASFRYLEKSERAPFTLSCLS